MHHTVKDTTGILCFVFGWSFLLTNFKKPIYYDSPGKQLCCKHYTKIRKYSYILYHYDYILFLTIADFEPQTCGVQTSQVIYSSLYIKNWIVNLLNLVKDLWELVCINPHSISVVSILENYMMFTMSWSMNK